MAKIPTVKIVLTHTDRLTMKVTIPGSAPPKYKFRDMEQRINPDQWDGKAGQCKKGHKYCEIINRFIFEERNKIVAAFEQDLAKKVWFSEAHITSRLLGTYTDVSTDFYAFCREQIALANYSSESRRTYMSEVTKLENFRPTLSFTEINFKWLQGYEKYMRDTLANHENTIWKTFKFMNTMCNRALKVGGIITENPFKDYNRGKYKQGMPLYLEWDEVEKLHATVKNKPLSDYTRLVGYYSLLSYYSGLRFGDAVNFNYAKKVIEDSTTKRLLLYAAKNGELVSIAFTKYIAEVVEYIKERPLVTTNQEFNGALKTIRGIAEIAKDITSHTGRHSFAVRCAELGMGIDDVQKLLGHNKRSSTEIYFRIKNRRLDESMKLWDKAKPRQK